jgi:hypothetical protein
LSNWETISIGEIALIPDKDRGRPSMALEYKGVRFGFIEGGPWGRIQVTNAAFRVDWAENGPEFYRQKIIQGGTNANTGG